MALMGDGAFNSNKIYFVLNYMINRIQKKVRKNNNKKFKK